MVAVIIQDTLPYTQSIASGSQTVFDADWTADDDSDVVVYARATGVAANDVTQIVSPNAYNVTFVGAEEYVRVTFLSGRTALDVVTITRNTPDSRDNLYTNTNFTPSMLNGDFGRQVMMIQQNTLHWSQLMLRYNTSATVQPIIDTILPILPASHTFRKNAGDTGFEAYELPDGGIAPADMTYLTLTDETADLENSFPLSAIGEGIMVNKTSNNTVLTRTLAGTLNQIDVLNGTGIGGNPTFSITSNPLIPGTAGMGIPQGTTAQRVTPVSGIGLRYNTTTGFIEYWTGSAWSNLDDTSAILALLASHTAGEGASLIGLESAGTVQDFTELEFYVANSSALAPNAIVLTPSDYLLVANNLNDVASVEDSRANLEVPHVSTFAGDPNTNVAGEVGDFCIDTTDSNALYMCTAAGVAADAVWDLQGGSTNIILGVDSLSTDDAYNIVTDPVVTVPVDGMICLFTAANTNTGTTTCTVTLNGGASYDIQTTFGNVPSPNTVDILNMNMIVYSSVQGHWVIFNSPLSVVNIPNYSVTQRYTLANDESVVADTITATPTYPFSVYPADQSSIINVYIANTNTGPTTIETLGAGGPLPVTYANGSALEAGTLIAGNSYMFYMNKVSTSWVVLNPSVTPGAYLPLAGGTMLGDIDMGGFKATNSAAPTDGGDLTNKTYVDTLIAAVAKIFSARLASTTALTVTYANGASGVGATLTNADVQAALTLDGVAAIAGDLVLMKNQAATLENGYYTVTDIGSGATDWVLTRSTLYDAPSEIEPGDLFVITAGDTLENTSWIQTSTIAAVGTDPITLSQYSVALPIPISQGGTGVTVADIVPVAGHFVGWDGNSNISANRFLTAYTTTATAAGTTTLDVTSTGQQYFTGVTTQTVVMPVAATVAVRDSWYIVNNSTDVVTVQSSGGNTIQAMAPNTVLLITCILSSGTDAASWNTLYSSKTFESLLSNPNLIIGGNFDTNPWQRGTTAAGLTGTSQTFLADRFKWLVGSDATVSYLKTADAPTVSESGVFTQNCLHIDVTTADPTIAAGQYGIVQYIIEGYDFAQIAQRSFTLSFWHKHTKTGTYCVGFGNTASDRSYVAEYTQAVSDTWEYSTITVSASPSAGTWNYTNGFGLAIYFTAAAGSTFQTTANSWQTGNYFATSNQVNGLDNTANNFKLALVKVEAGTVATGFSVTNFEEEYDKCLRYYQKTFPIATAPAQNAGRSGAWEFFQNRASSTATVSAPRLFVVPMRAVPTVVTYNPSAANAQIRNLDTGADFTGTGVDTTSDSEKSIGFAGTGDVGLAITNLCSIHATFDAEL